MPRCNKIEPGFPAGYACIREAPHDGDCVPAISDIELARSSDKMAKRLARSNYGPLPEEPVLDAYEFMMGNTEP